MDKIFVELIELIETYEWRLKESSREAGERESESTMNQSIPRRNWN